MTNVTITDETIAKLETAGFKRWTKSGMDRLYIDADKLGLSVKTYKSGNASGDGTWCGSEVCKVDADDILHSKIWIDIATVELHVVTDFTPCRWTGEPSVEDAAIAYVESVLGSDEADETITLDPECTINGSYIGAPKVSGKPVDAPTSERVTVELNGSTYERTVHERTIWRNMKKNRVIARFVTIDGINYLV